MTKNSEGVPVIALSEAQSVEKIASACSTWGGFVLTDHDIPGELITKVFSLGNRFFDLSQEQKDAYKLQLYGTRWRGYMQIGGERSLNGQVVDYKEGLYLGDEHSPDDPRVLNNVPTYGSNVYPDKEIPEMRKIFTEYNEKMKMLGDKIMKVLSLGLGLDEGYLEEHVTKHDPVILPRMFRYPPQEKEIGTSHESIKYGIGRHSDYGLWTMIITNKAGLQFEHPVTKEWHDVPYVENGIIMNVGDVLDRMTGGKFISPYHRALNRSSIANDFRLSLPFFYDPAWTARMKTLPIPNLSCYETPERFERWSKTKITCTFVDASTEGGVEYSEFLSKKVAKVFPELVPKEVWKNLSSTSSPSTRHALVVTAPDKILTECVIAKLKDFYTANPQIKESHGIKHVMKVYTHTVKAIACCSPSLKSTTSMEIKIAALLHDVDDKKYFPRKSQPVDDRKKDLATTYVNAAEIMHASNIPEDSIPRILFMIGIVSCSENGNSVPDEIRESSSYYLLIPRWADRLEAVGARGVVRCYQYNKEHNRPLFSDSAPRAKTVEEVWNYATPDRFVAYQERGGSSDDMISHYYDKLLHIAKPPKDIVRNEYLEKAAQESVKELEQVCVKFGQTGCVDEDYINRLIATN